MKFLNLFKTGLLLASNHKSAIMSGFAIVTGIAGTFFAVKATVKSIKDVEKASADKQEAVQKEEADNETEQSKDRVRLTKWEVVKVAWKNFIPVVIVTAATVTLIICAHNVDAKRIAASASALVLSEKMNRELQNKTIEELGKEKATEIKDAIFKKNPDLAKAYESGLIKKTSAEKVKSNGKTYQYVTSDSYQRHCWFRDEISGREFWSTKNEVECAVNKAMRDAITGCCPVLSLNSWYDWLGLDGTVMGDMLGWDMNRGQEIVVDYEPDIRDDGDPCLIIHYADKPRLI